MRCRVYIGTILYFNSLCEVLNQPPELLLNLIFRWLFVGVGDRVKDSFAGKVGLFEVLRLLLELLQRVDTAFFKAKFTCTNEAPRTVPVICRNTTNWRVKTISMISIVAAVAEQDVGWIVVCTASLATLYSLVMIQTHA